jgi:hypothetical protein
MRILQKQRNAEPTEGNSFKPTYTLNTEYNWIFRTPVNRKDVLLLIISRYTSMHNHKRYAALTIIISRWLIRAFSTTTLIF